MRKCLTALFFEVAITQKWLDQGARNVLYVLFYKLSDDTSYFSNERT